MGECTRAGGSDGTADEADSLAYAADAEAYAARLLCRADFGCVQFAPRG